MTYNRAEKQKDKTMEMWKQCLTVDPENSNPKISHSFFLYLPPKARKSSKCLCLLAKDLKLLNK